MALIIKKLEFTISETDNFTEKSLEYFTKSGFKHIGISPIDTTIHFERGSIASNMWTLTPLKWKSEIDIELSENQVKATFKINAAGQIPTTKDDKLWETFIANYQKYVCDANFDYLNENSEKLKSAKRSNLKYIGWAGIGGLIGGLPAVLIAQLTEINSVVSVGAALGAVVFLMIKINADTKKRDI